MTPVLERPQKDGRRASRRAALAIGIIGGVGESLLFRHDLADCYPFKVMHHPPASFFRGLGNAGGLGLLLVTIGLAWLLARRERHVIATWIIPSVIPVLGLLAYFAILLPTYGLEVPDGVRNFDGTTTADVTREFARVSMARAGWGSVIGGACAVVFAAFGRRR